MNTLDRFITWLNPQAGLRRANIRRALLAYDGAETGRRRDSWAATNADANAEVWGSLPRLRARSRDLVRSNPFAASAATSWVTRIVGTGIHPRVNNEILAAAWASWSKQCSADGLGDFAAVQALVERTVFESGECLVRFRYRKLSDGVVPPLQVQVLEPDYIDQWKSGPVNNGPSGAQSGYIIQGVQFNLLGTIEGYWLFGQHPGASVMTGVRAGLSLQSRFVSASEVLHIFEATRPGQVRGVPRMAPVLTVCKDLADYEDAELVRKRTESCLALIVESPETESGDGPHIGAVVTDSQGNAVEQFSPGMIARTKPGEAVKFNQPGSAGGYHEYKANRVHDICAGIGIPYEMVVGDFSGVNYSSYQAGLLAFRDLVEVHQNLVLIPQLCVPVWREFLSAMKLMDPRLVGEEAKWTPPSFDLLNRLEEAKADALELMIGKYSWPQVAARNGNDPARLIAEIAEWRPLVEAAGLQFNQKAATPTDQSQQEQGNGN